MSLPQINHSRDLNSEEIKKRIIQVKKDLFNIRLKRATKQNIKSHIFKHRKHELAQLLMLETKKSKE
uniref:Large ribosomal subunit protein uL29c n=1 Tax=Grateloupia turuturu TaxID=118375 RepID=A0A6B9P4E3_9FLOR|nr:50S ribosomal protein L29 [Grateloupia turuturu]QHD45296.1 50S ribosomal protein L29 [Grateloupia turuturu]UXC96840.1 50S ribosomal protein L29 [Grateloupia turuturu]